MVNPFVAAIRRLSKAYYCDTLSGANSRTVIIGSVGHNLSRFVKIFVREHASLYFIVMQWRFFPSPPIIRNKLVSPYDGAICREE